MPDPNRLTAVTKSGWITACSATQASLVINLRPFVTNDDFAARTRKQKGVGNAMMETYQGVVAGMLHVDTVLSECEAIGKSLSKVMTIWAGGNAEDAELGVNLVTSAASTSAVVHSTDPEVTEAFKGYLTEQPSSMSPKIKLKDYQMLGLNWLNLLYTRKTSCILADEMGTCCSDMILDAHFAS